MPDTPTSAAILRARLRAAPRRWAMCLALISLAAAASAPSPGAPWSRRALLLVNESPSAPRGLYVRVTPPQIAAAPGLFVTVRAAQVAGDYVRRRGGSDRSARLIKHSVGQLGSRFCAYGAIVTRDGSPIATRRPHDAAGRRLPRWTGCHVLRAGEAFLLGDTPTSFDSRYWGRARRGALEGVWRPLLVSRRRPG